MTSKIPPFPGLPPQGPPGCPDCGAVLDAPVPAHCFRCRLPLSGEVAGRLWQVERELEAIEQRRLTLLRMRSELLDQLRGQRLEPKATQPQPAVAPVRGAGQPASQEVSGRSAQTVLLVLGAVLVSIAALVFTVVSWGRLGIGGRATVLLSFTVCALAAPLPLRHRRLHATAETFAAIGLILVLLDCLSLRYLWVAGSDFVSSPGYWAAATALVAVGSVAYGWALRMRVPLLAGFLLALLPGLLIVSAAELDGLTPPATAMVATAALDYALLRALAERPEWRARLRADKLLPAAAVITTCWAVIGAALALDASLDAGLDLGLTADDDRVTASLRAWLPLGLLSLLTLAVALPHPRLGYPGLSTTARRFAAALAGSGALAAAGGTLSARLPDGWGAVGYAAPAALLTVAATARWRQGRREGRVIPVGLLLVAGGLGSALALVSAVRLVPAVVTPAGHLPAAWVNGSAPTWSWPVPVTALTVLWLLLAAAGAVRALGLASAGADAALSASTAVGLALLPVAFGLPYPMAVGTATALALVGGWYLSARPELTAGVLTSWSLALLWALADRPATIAVLALGAALAVALTVRGRPAPAVTAALAVAALGAEAAAVAATAGLALPDTLLAVLAVGLATAPVAARLTAQPVAPAVEFTGYGLTVLALLLTTDRPGRLSFDLAVTGVAALGLALRADRRRIAPVVGVAMLIGASWIRLAQWEVRTPEAYTLVLAAAALVLGHLWRRRFPGTGSWPAHGPGLAVGLLPSLPALVADGHWLRPLLLGCAALAATVLGVRLRLQSPVVLGGATLLTVAVHELAPTVVQVFGLLPRWVPLAAAGLLLLALGATYEQRLRDARRLHGALRRYS
ncbi:SCO7613 C-terminal domain-containing membrane protein [Kitasatospora sp. NPDC001159]